MWTFVILSSATRAFATANTALFGLTPSDGVVGDGFGWPVSNSGDYAIVGAARDDYNKGSVYIYARSGTTWTEQQKLTASNGGVLYYFGYSVSISGDYAIVGSPGGDFAYAFVRSGTTWTEQQMLTASDRTGTDLFGISVSISGSYAIVGARDDDSSAGSAYIFVRSGTTWTQQQKLTASDRASNDLFGHSVSISGDSAVVGAPYNDDYGTATGSAYVFVRSGTTWSQQQKLTASDAAPYSMFATSVSISGQDIIIGAYDEGSLTTGSAYVFTRSGGYWNEEQKLTASDYKIGFGREVSISGDVAIVGAVDDASSSLVPGDGVYLFQRVGTTWTEEKHLAGQFGRSVSIFGDYAVVGGYDTPAYAFNVLDVIDDSPSLPTATSGTQSHRIQALCLSALAVCVTLLV